MAWQPASAAAALAGRDSLQLFVASEERWVAGSLHLCVRPSVARSCCSSMTALQQTDTSQPSRPQPITQPLRPDDRHSIRIRFDPIRLDSTT